MKRKYNIRIWLAPIAAAMMVLVGGSALAQIESPPMIPMARFNLDAQSFSNVLGSNTGRAAVRPSQGAVAPRVSAQSSTGAYRVNPAVRRRVENLLVEAASRQGAGQASEMRRVIDSQDAMTIFNRGFGYAGLRTGNAVDALTGYWLVTWGVANDRRTPFTRAEVQAVKKQVISGAVLSRAGLDSSDKLQEFSETLIYQTLILDTALERAQGSDDTAAIRSLGDVSVSQMRGLGIDLRRLRLTDQGFVAA